MSQPADEHDDSFLEYVASLSQERDGLRKMLQYIKDNLGGVCEDFLECRHRGCNDSCTAYLIASAALEGQYETPEEEMIRLRTARL